MRKIRKRRMAAVMVLCVGLLSGCAGKTQTDDLVITIPEYEKITYTTEPVVHGDIAPVPAIPVLAYQHNPFFPIDPQQVFPAFGADFPGNVVMDILSAAVGHGLYQFFGITPDSGKKSVLFLIALADGFQPAFPLGSEQGLL